MTRSPRFSKPNPTGRRCRPTRRSGFARCFADVSRRSEPTAARHRRRAARARRRDRGPVAGCAGCHCEAPDHERAARMVNRHCARSRAGRRGLHLPADSPHITSGRPLSDARTRGPLRHQHRQQRPQQRHRFAGWPKAGVCADAEAANLDSTDRFPHRDAARRKRRRGAGPVLVAGQQVPGIFRPGQAEEDRCRRRPAANALQRPGRRPWRRVESRRHHRVWSSHGAAAPGIGERRRAIGRDQVSGCRRRALESIVLARRAACLCTE